MNTTAANRPTYAEIDLEALSFNYRSVNNFVGKGVGFMAVVKANAYGHGAIECSKVLEAAGVDWFAVATAEEATELRLAAIRRPILVLGGIWPGQHQVFIDNDLTPAIFTLEQAINLNEVAQATGRTFNVHLKIDTGMGRMGFRSDESQAIADRFTTLNNINVEGLMTHFAAADDLSQTEFTNRQISAFQRCVEVFHSRGISPKYIDLANSPAAIAHPSSRADLVRIGGILYGLGGDVLPAGIEVPKLKRVMSIRSHIAQLKHIRKGETIGYSRTFTANRDSLIATIPIGYHDGLRRGLSNTGQVIVNGMQTNVVGRVSMDWTSIDVSAVSGVSLGDQVTIIGKDGNEEIGAEDIARELSTISYEITCGVSSRVPRIYK